MGSISVPLRLLGRQEYILKSIMPFFLLGHYVPPPSDSTIGSNLSEILDRTHLGSSEAMQVNGTTPPGMPKPVSNWSRSYQNPVGTIYYPPSEADR